MSVPTRFHFIGICGTAMGAVAAAMKQRGFGVSGSDANVYPPMSDFLRDQGIAITTFSPLARGFLARDADHTARTTHDLLRNKEGAKDLDAAQRLHRIAGESRSRGSRRSVIAVGPTAI